MRLVGHMPLLLFQLVWGIGAKFGLCHCFKQQTVSYAARYASCLCIHLCSTVSKINRLSVSLPPPSPLISNNRETWCLVVSGGEGGSHPEGAEGATWVPALSGGVKLVLKQHWTEEGKWAAVQGEKREG